MSNKKTTIARVASDWQMDVAALAGCVIVFHEYTYGYFSGNAFTLFTKNGKLYESNGSHCSCYGLDGQWSEEETTVEAIMFRIDRGNFDGVDKRRLLAALKTFKPALDNIFL